MLQVWQLLSPCWRQGGFICCFTGREVCILWDFSHWRFFWEYIVCGKGFVYERSLFCCLGEGAAIFCFHGISGDGPVVE